MATPKIGDGMLGWLGATPMESNPAQLQSIGPGPMAGPQPLTVEELAAIPPEQRKNIPPEMMPKDFPISTPQAPPGGLKGFGQALKYAGGKFMSEYPVAASTGLVGIATGAIGSSPEDTRTVGESLIREAQRGKGEQKAPTAPQVIAGTEMAREEQQKAADLGIGLTPPPRLNMPALTAKPEDLDKAQAIMQQAINNEQAIKEAELAKKADLIASHREELALNEEAEALVRAGIDEGYKGFQATHEKLSSELNNMPSVNPDRYWQNKSGFQKGMSALAGFLFGLSGKGMDYLHLIDQEIERDVNAQKFDIEGKRRDIGTKLQSNMNVYGMFKERGFNSLQAVAATRIHKIDQYTQAVNQLSEETDSKLTKTKAEQATGALMQERVKWKMEFDKVSQTRATLDYQQRRQQWEFMAANAQRQAAMAQGAAKQAGLDATAATKLAEKISSLGTLNAMEKAAGEAGGSGLWNMFKRRIQAGLEPVADVEGAKRGAYEAGKFEAGQKIFGALRKEDMPNLDILFGSRSGIKSPVEAVNEQRKKIVEEVGAQLRAYRAQGKDVSGLEQLLQQELGVRGEKSQ